MFTSHRYTWRQVIYLSYTSLKFELFILNASFVFLIRSDHDYVEAYPSPGLETEQGELLSREVH